MNSLPDSPTPVETLQKYISRSVQVCISWIPCMQRQQRVHPTNKNFGYNAFLEFHPNRQIRVIHIDPKLNVLNSNGALALPRLTPTICKTEAENVYSRSLSIVSNTSDGSSDDYWFTRWSRPLAITNNCNCSFRQKWRKSLRSTSISKSAQSSQSPNSVHFDNSRQVLTLNEASTVACASEKDKIPLNLIKVVAEDFIEDILKEAIANLCSKDVIRLESCDKNEIKPPTETQQKQQVAASPISNHTTRRDSGRMNASFVPSPCDPSSGAKTCGHGPRRARKPTLLFLHGAGGTSDIWWSQLHHFASAGFEVVAPDMLGHGLSGAPDRASAYTFQQLLKDALDVFDRFVGEHGSCVVIGHSYGCSLAAAVARYRTQVTHLVLISGGSPTPLAPTQLPPLIPCLEGCLKPFIACGVKRQRLYAACGKQPAACSSLGGAPARVLRLVARGQDWAEGDATFHRRILVPTLLVHGARDPHVSLVQQCEMERTIPRSFLELIPNAGHLSMLETPLQLSHMIHCFINWWTR